MNALFSVRQSLGLIVRSVGLLLLGVVAASAQVTLTWNGGSTDNSRWTTGSNWVGGAAPSSSINTSLIFSGSTRLAPDMSTDFTLKGLTFASGAGSFILGSSTNKALTIDSGGLTNSATSNSATITETITNAI